MRLDRRSLLVAAVTAVPAMRAAAQASRLPGEGRGAQATVAAETVARFPTGTFLESIVALPDGAVLFNDHDRGLVYRLAPGGGPEVVARVPGKLAGLAPLPSDDGALLASGWAADGAPAVFRIARDGVVSELVRPAGAAFLNGFAHLRGARYLLADSARGMIWLVDAERAAAEPWLAHASMTRRAAENANPGVNGLKIHDGVLYVTNSDRALISRIRLTAEDGPGGAPEVFLDDMLCDDLAFSEAGDMFLATHPLNSVVRISPSREIAVLGGREQGLTGPTAVAFGRGPSTGWLYAVTTGGVFAPPPGGPVPAEVVRLRVGVAGAPVLRG
jgi:sugar lactone lactonase YvrE